MISLTRFRANLLPLFRVMTRAGLYVDVSYQGRAYRVTVEDIGIAKKQRRGGRRKSVINIEDIEDSRCLHCGKLQVAGVCMNSVCSSRSVPRQRSPEL